MQYQYQPQNNNNPNIIQCHACGNMMGRYADSCPYCGTPRPKKVANPMWLDVIAVFAIIFSLVSYVVRKFYFGFITMLVLLMIYYFYYSRIKDNPDIDSSKVKQSLNILTVIFIILFALVLIINW